MSEQRVELPVGSELILYTDGLVERRGRALDVGIDTLASRVRADGETLADLRDGLVHTAHAGRHRRRHRDPDRPRQGRRGSADRRTASSGRRGRAHGRASLYGGDAERMVAPGLGDRRRRADRQRAAHERDRSRAPTDSSTTPNDRGRTRDRGRRRLQRDAGEASGQPRGAPRPRSRPRRNDQHSLGGPLDPGREDRLEHARDPAFLTVPALHRERFDDAVSRASS